MSDPQIQGDYVLVPARKAKISRARKSVIGLMVLGAIAALGGAGSFASFSATTTNQGVFRTGRVILSNAVNEGQACFSSGTGPGATATSDADLDANDTDCADLFSTEIRLGVTSTAYVTVENASDYDFGRLYLFGIDANNDTTNDCIGEIADSNFSRKGTGNICSVVDMQIQEVTAANGTGVATGNYCVFPDGGANCSTFGDLLTFPAGYADDAARLVGSVSAGVTKHFRIVVTAPDQAVGATGWDPDNVYQNQRPNLKLRWLLVDAATA